MSRIAFLGLGAMGSRMVPHLMAAGHELVVWNRTPAATAPLAKLGARVAGTPREAATGAEVVMTMLSDDQASEAVWLHPEHGALRGLGRGTIAIEMSTVSPGWIERLDAAITQAGGSLLDAPVAGSLPQVEERKLVFMVGGKAAALERVQDVLACLGSAVHHVGASGQGAAMKLAVNAMLGVQVVAIGELMESAARHGLARDRFAQVLGSLPTVGPAALGFLRMMLADDYAPRFRLDLMAKDFVYAVVHAKQAGVESRVVQAALESFEQAVATGLGAQNMHAVVKLHDRALKS